MIDVAVKSLLCDAMRKRVSASMCRSASRSACPESTRPDQVLVRDHAHDDAREPPDGDLTFQPGREELDLGLDFGSGSEALPLGRRWRKDERGKEGECAEHAPRPWWNPLRDHRVSAHR